MAVFQDKTGDVTEDAIFSGQAADRFVPPPEGLGPVYGYSVSPFWIRIQLENSDTLPKSWYLEVKNPTVDKVALYAPDGSGGYQSREYGDSVAHTLWEVDYRHVVFTGVTPPKTKEVYYLRAQFVNSGPAYFPLELWSPERFRVEKNYELFYVGLYVGIMGALILYNLFLFSSLRDETYLVYTGFVLSVMVTHLSVTGFTFQYLWPEDQWWGNNGKVFVTLITFVMGTIFTRMFLQTKENAPRWDWLMRGILYLTGAGVLFSLFDATFFIAVKILAVMLLAIILYIFTGLAVWRNGYKPAVYYVIAWTALLLCTMTLGILMHGFIPYHPLVEVAPMFGGVLDVILLSFALAYRVQLLREAKDQAGREREKALSRADELNAKLEEAQRIAHIGHWELAPESGELAWSDEVYRIYGLDRERFTPDYRNFLERIHKEDRARVDGLYTRSVRNLEPFNCTHRVVRPDGEERIVEERCEHTLGRDGKVVHSLGTVLDITERRRLEEKQREQEKLLIQQSKMAAMGEMIGMIAHQWRQPLSVLSLNADNLRFAAEDHDLDEQLVMDTTDRMSRQIRYMNDTVDDFRNFLMPSKSKTVFDLEEAVRETLKVLAARLKKDGVAVEVEMEEGTAPEAFGYASEFKQVLFILLNNGVDAVAERYGEGAGKGEIRISIRNEGKWAAVGVRDNGNGIDPAFLPRLFEPYATTKGEQGTGIGLNMARMILENMGGTIRGENVEEGACFTVGVPRAGESKTND